MTIGFAGVLDRAGEALGTFLPRLGGRLSCSLSACWWPGCSGGC